MPKIGAKVTPTHSLNEEHEPVDMLQLRMMQENLTIYNTTLIETGHNYAKELCSSDLCCQFSIDVEFQSELITGNQDFYKYRIAAFGGTRNLAAIADAGLRVCAIFACTDTTVQSCGTR